MTMTKKSLLDAAFEADSAALYRETYGSEPLTTEATRAFTERTGFQPTSEERHMLALGFAPTFMVAKLHGESQGDPETAAWLRQRTDALVAWRNAWRDETSDFPVCNPWAEIAELSDVD